MKIQTVPVDCYETIYKRDEYIVTIRGETQINLDSGNTVKEGQIVLFDAVAAYDMNYACDLTTTCPVKA